MLCSIVRPEHSGSGRYQGSGDNRYTVWISHGLFSDVSTVNFISDGITAKSTDGVVYTLSAADYFGGARITDATTLVYDAANKVVYLEGVANVPEPASATLSLLALSGLLARRRRGMR